MFVCFLLTHVIHIGVSFCFSQWVVKLSMPHSPSCPICEVWIPWRREETPVVLRWCSWSCCSRVASLLLLPLAPGLFTPFTLLSVVDKEGKRKRQAHDDDRVYEAVIVSFACIVRCIAAGHGIVVVIIVQPVVVVEVILDEIVDPLTERPVFLGF